MKVQSINGGVVWICSEYEVTVEVSGVGGVERITLEVAATDKGSARCAALDEVEDGGGYDFDGGVHTARVVRVRGVR